VATRFPANTLPQKRRDQNRIAQRAFRQRKDKHARDLEAKIEELEAQLEMASYKNTAAKSRMHRMEAELSFSRGLLFAAAWPNNTRVLYLVSYPATDIGSSCLIQNRTSPFD
jgi:hypothetical protein